jgi:hypothetical protein
MRLAYLESASATNLGVVLLHSFTSAEVRALRDEIATVLLMRERPGA